MSNIIQVCLYNTEPEASDELRAHIAGINFVRLVAEVRTPDQLHGLIHEMDISLLFFHLDPNPDSVIEVIDQVSTRFPEMALIAISHQTGPAAILAPIRAGCDQYVCEPIDPEELATVVARVASKRLLVKGKSRCICVVGASGGSGSTSIACNLALEIGHMTEKPCALVDLDFQFGDIAINFDCEPKYTLHDLADTGGHIDRSVLASVMTALPCHVQLLARPQGLEQYEAIHPDVIHHTIDLLKTTFESVVCDLPRRLDQHTYAAIGQADLVIIVCQLVVPSVRNATRIFEAIVQAGVPEERIEVVINRGDSGGGRVTAKDIEETIRKPIFASIPNDYQFVARSLDFGRPIAALDRNNAVRSAIGKMAKRIMGDAAGESSKDGAKRGFLSRLLAK